MTSPEKENRQTNYNLRLQQFAISLYINLLFKDYKDNESHNKTRNVHIVNSFGFNVDFKW